MKIALTYDLKEDYLKRGFMPEQTAEFDKPETIDSIANALRKLGHQVEKIGGIKALIVALAQHNRWDLVFNIAEGMYGYGREAAIPSILEAYNIAYTFSDPRVLAISLDKGLTKRIIQQLGIATADFAVINEADEAAKVKLPYPLFVKPVAEGTGKGISSKSLVNSPVELTSLSKELLERFAQPLLVETYLPGREFTAGIIGTGKDAKVLGILEVNFKTPINIYCYATKADYRDKIAYTLLKEPALINKITAMSLQTWRGLECRDAGRIDLRLNANNEPMFMEINPLAGLHPIDSDLIILCGLLNIAYQDLIKMILDSALKRINKP
jgi:D-alanine-D-alanine ligase